MVGGKCAKCKDGFYMNAAHICTGNAQVSPPSLLKTPPRELAPPLDLAIIYPRAILYHVHNCGFGLDLRVGLRLTDYNSLAHTSDTSPINSQFNHFHTQWRCVRVRTASQLLAPGVYKHEPVSPSNHIVGQSMNAMIDFCLKCKTLMQSRCIWPSQSTLQIESLLEINREINPSLLEPTRRSQHNDLIPTT